MGNPAHPSVQRITLNHLWQSLWLNKEIREIGEDEFIRKVIHSYFKAAGWLASQPQILKRREEIVISLTLTPYKKRRKIKGKILLLKRILSQWTACKVKLHIYIVNKIGKTITFPEIIGDYIKMKVEQNYTRRSVSTILRRSVRLIKKEQQGKSKLTLLPTTRNRLITQGELWEKRISSLQGGWKGQGLRVTIGGRIKGNIATQMKLGMGQLQRQTLSSPINYSARTIRTRKGSWGLKIITT